MLLIVGLIAILLISFFLAYRSMKDFREHPSKALEYGIFLIRSPQNFTPETLNFLYYQSKEKDFIFSIEYLLKGADKAYVLYLPKFLAHEITALHLLEIEDYLPTFQSQHIAAMEFYLPSPDKNPKLEVIPGSLQQIKLEPNDRLCFQIACLATKPGHHPLFQIHPKLLISSPSFAAVKALNEIYQQMEKYVNMRKLIKPQSSRQIYGNALKRNLIPIEVESFLSTPRSILDLLS